MGARAPVARDPGTPCGPGSRLEDPGSRLEARGSRTDAGAQRPLAQEGLLASPFFPDAPHGRQGQRRPSQASPRSTGMPFGLLEATPPASEPSLDNSSAREVSPAVLEAPSHHGQSFPRVLIQVIAAYCAIGGFASANGQMFVLIVSIPASSGGFGLGPATIGLLQNVAAVLGRVPGGLGFGARVGGLLSVRGAGVSGAPLPPPPP
ncbi:unnamed protein product, partial [Prorocentrum cordatum]